MERATRLPTRKSAWLFYFNPRSRGGSDLKSRCRFSPAHLFQSTLPRRERRIQSTIVFCFKLFQSTLPRRERHRCAVHLHQYFRISIHAPAEGATDRPCRKAVHRKISIHAPAEGATSTRGWQSRGRTHFNPRSRGGSDI